MNCFAACIAILKCIDMCFVFAMLRQFFVTCYSPVSGECFKIVVMSSSLGKVFAGRFSL